MNKKDIWFKARYNWSEIFDDLSDNSLRVLILTIWKYAKDGTDPESIPQEIRLAWRLIKGELDQDTFFRECGKRGGNPHFFEASTESPSTGVKGGLKGGSLDKNKKREEENKKRGDINNIPPTANNEPIPSFEEVRQHCLECGVDPEKFYDHYQKSGWTTKDGQRVKDWKTCVRAWARISKGGNDGFSRSGNRDRVPGQRDLYE